MTHQHDPHRRRRAHPGRLRRCRASTRLASALTAEQVAAVAVGRTDLGRRRARSAPAPRRGSSRAATRGSSSIPRTPPTRSSAPTTTRPRTRRRSRRSSADAGFPRESFTHAIATHIEGIGMLAWRNDDGSWAPFFPNAPILMSQRELDAIDARRASVVRQRGARRSSRAQGAVQAVDRRSRARDRRRVARAHAARTPPGHQIVRVASDGEQAVMRRPPRGQPAASRAPGRCPQQHLDPEAAQRSARQAARGRRGADRPALADARRRPLGRRRGSSPSRSVPTPLRAIRRGRGRSRSGARWRASSRGRRRARTCRARACARARPRRCLR